MQRAAIALLFTLGGATGSLGADRPRAFVELFTSQGCAACPAADALLARLNEDDSVLAVTMPVQLWDFLGWIDTLATETGTKRQIAYSVARGDQDIYTPQMVINGHRDVLGSDMAAIKTVLNEDAIEPLPLPIDLSSNAEVLSIAVGVADIDESQATLWLMVVDETVRVPVRGGENRGRRLVYHNVVREMRPVGVWKGDAMVVDIPLIDIEKAHLAGSYVIAQVENFKGPGRIIGAQQLDRLFPVRTIRTK